MTALRAAAGTDHAWRYQNWLELGEGDPEVLTQEETAAVILLFAFINTTCDI